MKRILFLLISLLLISTSQSFSQDDKKGAKQKRKMQREIKKEKEREKKSIEKENKKYGGKKKELEQQDNYTPTYSVKAIKVVDSIYMLEGKGGNIGVFIGNDGVLMVDDQFAEGTEEILKKVSRLSNKPVEFLINTHHHKDHTGGNENMLGNGVVIFAQENVRKRLIAETVKKAQDSLEKVYKKNLKRLTEAGASEGRATVGAKKVANSMEESLLNNNNNLPIITFEENLTFYFNNEKILVFHVHNAHTDGDSLVYFTDSNVLQTGDVFFNGKYPFIDKDNGGSYDGYMRALSKILMLVNDDTKIIPGHGEIATKMDVKYTQSMLEFLHSKVAYYYIGRKSKEEIMSMKDITKQFDDKGYGNGFISTEKFLNFIYDDVVIQYRDKRVKQ